MGRIGFWLFLRIAVFINLLILCLSGTVWAQPDLTLLGFNFQPNIVYSTVGGRSLKLDLYLPKGGPGLFPAVVLIHGEQPSDQGRDYYRQLATLAATRGEMAAAVIEYRKAADAAFPGAIDDAKAAVRWLRANSAKYRINPDRIGAAGENFGGYIAAMLALEKSDPLSAVQSVALVSPVTDLSDYSPPPDGYPYHYALFLRYPQKERPDSWRAASPLTHAGTASSSFLLLHGTEDRRVPISQSKAFVEAIRKAGADAELIEFAGAGNGLLGAPETQPRVMRRIAQYLSRALWAPPPGVTLERDIVYSRPEGRERRLDLFRPAEAGRPRPAVVFIHGGGWLWGSKLDHWPTAGYLASRGFVTISIEYRLARERIYPAALDDAKAAVSWLKANAARYGVDPQRIGATGSSAGGHLVSMLGVVPASGPANNAPVKAVAAVAAPVDLSSQFERDRYSPSLLLGAGSPTEHPERWAEASPVNHVNRHAATFLFLHGTKDGLVSLTDVEKMIRLLSDAGVTAEVHIADGGTHDFFFEYPWRWPAVRRMEDFFVKTLALGSSR
jgi:acetyl esterase/lipase